MKNPPSPEETRRPGIPVRPIVLADGRAWGFAIPSLRLRPVVVMEWDDVGRETPTVIARADSGHPPEIRQLLEDLSASRLNATPDARLEAFFRLALALLRRGHDVDVPTAAELLEVGPDNLPRLVREVLDIAGLGRCVPLVLS